MADPVPATTAQRLFRYRAREEATGRMRTGERPGTDAYTVRAALRRVGLAVERIEPVPTAEPLRARGILGRSLTARRRRRRRSQRTDILDALATMLGAGLSLDAALGTLIDAPTRPTAEVRMLTALREQLRAGGELADACTAHGGWFDALDVAMIRAGQEAGDLVPILRSLAEHHQRIGALGHRLFAALAYPTLLLLLALAVMVFLSLTTLPQLMAIIVEGGHEPPRLTASVVACGRLLAHRWYLVALVLVSVGALAKTVPRLVPARSRPGRWLANTLLARTRRRSRIANFAATLARLLRSGLPLVEAMRAVAEASDDAALRRTVDAAIDAVHQGGNLSDSLAGAGLMEPEFAQLMRLGEDAGELPAMLDRVAERYRRLADRNIERLTVLLEPLAILVLALVIGLVAMAAIQPLLMINEIL